MPALLEARRRARPPHGRHPRGATAASGCTRRPRCSSPSAARCAPRSASRGARTPASARCRLVYYGTEAQKQQLPAEARDRRVARRLRAHRAGLGQRRARGEDARRCRDPDGGYRLTGTKQFITNAGFADLFTVFAKVDGEQVHRLPRRAHDRRRVDRARGEEARHQGLVDPPAHPRGRAASPADARPRRDRPGPQDRLQHPEHRPLQARRRRRSARPRSASQIALDYARDRKQFGQPIASFGMIQRKLADMATRIYVADSMSYRTAGLMDAAADAIDPDAPDVTQAARDASRSRSTRSRRRS